MNRKSRSQKAGYDQEKPWIPPPVLELTQELLTPILKAVETFLLFNGEYEAAIAESRGSDRSKRLWSAARRALIRLNQKLRTAGILLDSTRRVIQAPVESDLEAMEAIICLAGAVPALLNAIPPGMNFEKEVPPPFAKEAVEEIKLSSVYLSKALEPRVDDTSENERLRKKKGKRGRKSSPEVVARRRNLINDWNNFRAGKHGGKKDFCKDRNLSEKNLDQFLAAERMAKRRKQGREQI